MDPILQWALGILGTIITGTFTGVIAPMMFKYFKSKTNNENVHAVLDELEATVSSSVGYLNQTFVDQLKTDGKWDAVTQKEALGKAVQEVLEGLSQRAKDIITNDELELKKIIIRHIEDEISKRKIAA